MSKMSTVHALSFSGISLRGDIKIAHSRMTKTCGETLVTSPFNHGVCPLCFPLLFVALFEGFYIKSPITDNSMLLKSCLDNWVSIFGPTP